MKTILFCISLVLVSGCATPEEMRQRNMAYTESVRERCDAYGFARGTEAHASCVMRIDQQNRAAVMQQLQRQQQPVPYQVIQPTPTVNTQCFTQAGYTTCTTR